jgi:hypothetical protein
MDWQTWTEAAWPSLKKGQRVRVPTNLPHPSLSGFSRPRVTLSVGQSGDWVRSYPDGSRLHVHEYSDGSRVAHRDATDPARGPFHAVWHVATETPAGRGVVRGTAVAAALWGFAKLLR